MADLTVIIAPDRRADLNAQRVATLAQEAALQRQAEEQQAAHRRALREAGQRLAAESLTWAQMRAASEAFCSPLIRERYGPVAAAGQCLVPGLGLPVVSAVDLHDALQGVHEVYSSLLPDRLGVAGRLDPAASRS